MSHDDGGGASRSTDPASGSSAATDVSLREYLTSLIDAVEKRSDARFDAMKEAVAKVAEANEKRFDSVNEFRQTLSDQAAQFVTRDTLGALADKLQSGIDRNREDLDTLAQRLDLSQGEAAGSRITKASLYTVITVATAVLIVAVALANYFATH